MTNAAIFENSRWRTTAILKIALSQYLSRELSDVDQIWCADADFNSQDGYLTKIEILQIQDGGRYIENRFCYISAPYWPIEAKFRAGMKNHMQIGHVTKTAIFDNSRWRTAAILKITISISQR